MVKKANRPLVSLWSGTGEYSELLVTYGMAKAFLGEFEGAYSSISRARDLALAGDERFGLLYVDILGGWASSLRGDWRDGLQRFRDAIKRGEEVHDVTFFHLAWGGTGWCHYLQGDLKTARECAEKAIRNQEASGIPIMASVLRLLKGMIGLDLGDLAAARSATEEALRLSLANNEKHFEGWARIWLGRITGKSGVPKLAEAEESILQGMKILHELEIKPFEASGYLFLGELYADAGQEERAISQLRKAKAMFQEMDMDYWLAKTEKVLEKLKER